ncbi:hypothetical protein BgAZ_103900 [Babesia gibsoni]|uniref:Uncharacterized protein n=1 Tax=Babesia gibsoni TaxID=33632 RepID=A0AAD8PFS2_BABGI|nr:hypothetical protein BgAZ_103900 [Babesia gibsoni]
MNETLGIGCPLRSSFLSSLSEILGCTLRINTARGVEVNANRLKEHLAGNDTLVEIKLKTKHLKGECRIILPVGPASPPQELRQPVEGIAFSLVRVSIAYNHTEPCLDVVASEATQLPPCPAGVEAWSHFTTYAEGLGYGSFEVSPGCGSCLYNLIELFGFNEYTASSSNLIQCSSLDSLLYVVWHWVCASYSMGFGVRLVAPHKDNIDSFSYHNVKNTFNRYLIPNRRFILSGALLDYLQSDMMVLPPSIAKVNHKVEEPESDFSDYSSHSDADKDVEYDWPTFEPFIQLLTMAINEYRTVVPSVNGTFLDEALWVSNNSIDSSCTRDVILQLKASSDWHHGVTSSAELVLYSGIYFRNYIQLRAFVINSTLVCLEQLFVNENMEFLSDEGNALVDHVSQYIGKLNGHLSEMTATNAIFDVTYSKKTGDMWLIRASCLGSLPTNLIPLEDVYHYYYTGVTNGIDLGGRAEARVINDILVVFLGKKSSRSKKHSWCPKDVGELKFNTPDDLIDFLRFQTSEC